MTDKYKVKILIKKHLSGGLISAYWYTCKHVVGGIGELVFKNEFDADWFAYAYNYSTTTLQFCKEDKKVIADYLSGNNYTYAPTQDRSYNVVDKVRIKIIDNYSGNEILDSFLDVSTIKYRPDYVEVALIEKDEIKGKIDTEVSYSLKELYDLGHVKKLHTDNYAGNEITENVQLLAEDFLDKSWGCHFNSMYVSQNPNWDYDFDSATTHSINFKLPSAILALQGSSETGIYNDNEYWGKYGGLREYNTTDNATSPAMVTHSHYGGFTLVVDKPTTANVNFNISLNLVKERFFCNNGWKIGYSAPEIRVWLDTFVIAEDGSRTFNKKLIAVISRTQAGLLDYYRLSDYNIPAAYSLNYVGNEKVTIHGEIRLQFSEMVARTDFEDYYRSGQTPLTNSDGSRLHSMFISSWSFKCDCIIIGFTNSILCKRNDIYGVPLIDYINFVANKSNIAIDASQLTAIGMNEILYSSVNFLNFFARGLNLAETDEVLETESLSHILDYLNKLFCLSIFVKNGTLTLISRNKYRNDYGIMPAEKVKANRILEICPKKIINEVNIGSVKYEKFASNYESMTDNITIFLQNDNNGEKLDISSDICTDPQFIDYLFVKSEPQGEEKFLVETDYDSIEDKYQLAVYAECLVAPNKTNDTTTYSGTHGYPDFTDWRERNWCNIHLSPLAQWARWRKFLCTTTDGQPYKIKSSKINFINVLRNIQTPKSYQTDIYTDTTTQLAILNNSNTLIGGLPAAWQKETPWIVRDKSLNGFFRPFTIKIETPIHDQFTNANERQKLQFEYNGYKIQGMPSAVETLFGYKVQEITVDLTKEDFEKITNLMD